MTENGKSDSPESLFEPGTELSAPVPDTPGRKMQQWMKNIRKPKLKFQAVSEMTWSGLWEATKAFLKDPVNLALTLWALLSVPACIVILAIHLGLLNTVLDKETKEKVEEISTQVVNALFVLTCLIIFPMLCRHTYLLCRWNTKDKVELRQAFCKNGKRKPHDRTHIAVVVFWGQITCWATFAFAAIYWVFPLGERPAWLISLTFVVSMVAPVISLIYMLLSPLSKDYDIVKEGDDDMLRMYQRGSAFFMAQKEVTDAQWQGTVVPGCCSNRKVACLTCLLPCCMFGYNMERLGFGHKAVHTLAFIIVLIGPVLVFQFSSQALQELHVAPRIVYYSGLLLAFFGLAYGGAWRIKMRKTYNLPSSRFCCGSEPTTDVCTWMCCSYCALCQEIRTVDQYQVEETDHFYSQAPNGEAGDPELVAPEDDMEDDVEVAQVQKVPPQEQKIEMSAMQPEAKADPK